MVTAKEKNRILLEYQAGFAEEMTGCEGAGDYFEWAKQQGYPYLAILDQTSSAGNWSFLVSQDEETWYLMTQENNYPEPGFTWTVHEEAVFVGAEEEALEQAYGEYC